MKSAGADVKALEVSAANLPWPAGLRVVLYELLSGTNDYGVELVQALAQVVPLTVVTVDNTKLPMGLPCKVMPVVPAFAKTVSRWRKSAAMAYAYFCLIKECLRQPRRTVLHVEFLRFAQFESRLFGLLQRLGVTLVYSAHNALPHDQLPWHPAFYRHWYERVDAVHVLSRSVQHTIQCSVGAHPKAFWLAGHGPYDGLKKTYTHLNGAEERRKRGIPEAAFVVLQYGLFKNYKGLRTLVEATCELRDRSSVFLVLAGAGPVDELDVVQRRLDDAQMAGRYLWYRDYVSDKNLCELIELSDVVVFPYQKVSQSGALYLAMTFGKAVLCSDLAGFRETLPDRDLFFFEMDSVHGLAQRLKELEAGADALKINRNLIEAMRHTGFDWAEIALNLKRMYSETHRTRS